MRIDKGEISGAKLALITFCFLQGSSLLTSFLFAVTKQDSWIAVLLAMAAGLPLILIYGALMRMFPDQNLIQMLDTIFGPVLGKILGFGYLWFFLTLASLNLTDLGNLTGLTIMDETPNLVLVTLCVLVAALAVGKGIRVVSAYSLLFALASTLILLISFFLLYAQFRPENLLPVFQLPLMRYVQGSHMVLTIPFGELVAFLMLTPNVRFSEKKQTRHLLTGFVLGGLSMLVVILRDILILGNTISLFVLPSLVVQQMARLGGTLSRLEVFFVIVLIMLLFFKVSLLYYVSVMSLSQLMKEKNFKHLVLPVGAFLVAYGSGLYYDQMEHAVSAQEIVPIAWSWFEIVLPAIALITAKIRKLPAKKEAA